MLKITSRSDSVKGKTHPVRNGRVGRKDKDMDEIIKRIEYLLELLQMSQEEVVIWRKETFGQDNIGVDCIDSYRCGYTESALRGILEMMKGDTNEKS